MDNITELDDADAPFPSSGPKPIDTAELRLELWSRACTGGASNVITVEGVGYCWDAHPRRLANGALQGRVYVQRRGESPHDIGGYKIDARGRVVHLPAELAGVLPGGLEAKVELTPSGGHTEETP